MSPAQPLSPAPSSSAVPSVQHCQKTQLHSPPPSVDDKDSTQAPRPQKSPQQHVGDASPVLLTPGTPRQSSNSGARRRRTSISSSSKFSPSNLPSPSPSGYFSPQPSASGTEPRSPASRRPPATFSSHGVATHGGPPITLITRGAFPADIARRVQNIADFEFTLQQLTQPGPALPGVRGRGGLRSAEATSEQKRRPGSANSKTVRSPPTPSQATSYFETQRRAGSDKMLSDGQVDSAAEDLSEQERDALELERQQAPPYSLKRLESTRSGHSTEAEGGGVPTGDDLFLNIAQDGSSRRGTSKDDGGVERRRVSFRAVEHSSYKF